MKRPANKLLLLTMLSFFGALNACKEQGGENGTLRIPRSGIYPESDFFQEFSFRPIPVYPGTNESSAPWVSETTGIGSISPFSHYPEREIRLIFTYIDDDPKEVDLDQFRTMILEAFESQSSPVISWKLHEETPYHAYGTYAPGGGMMGRIWINIAPIPSLEKIHLHIRMIEQPDYK